MKNLFRLFNHCLHLNVWLLAVMLKFIWHFDLNHIPVFWWKCPDWFFYYFKNGWYYKIW